MPSCPFSSFSYPPPPSSSRPLRSEILFQRHYCLIIVIISLLSLSHLCHLIIVISIFEVRFFFLEYLGEKYKCPWRKKNLLLLRIFCGEQGEIGVEFDLKFCNQFCIAFTFRKLFKMKRFFGSSTSLTKPQW